MEREKLLEVEKFFVETISEYFGEAGEEELFRPCNGRGIFGGALTVWLMLVQALKGVSMKEALTAVEKGAAKLILEKNPDNKKARLGNLSSSTGGLSQARQRLPEVDVEEIVEALNQGLIAPSKSTQKILAIDGLTVALPRTKDILRDFSPRILKGTSPNLPEALLVIGTDIESGVTTKAQYGAVAGRKVTSEQALARSLMSSIPSNTMLVGDANFGVFSFISGAMLHGQKVVVRLHEHNAKKFLEGHPSTGPLDIPVMWKASQRDQVSTEEKQRGVEGRFIRQRIHTKGFRPFLLYIFTTSSLPAEEIISIYGKRYLVETDIRYLKHTFKMERFLCKTQALLYKEILVRMCAYNLLRHIVRIAAKEVGLEPRQVSFTYAITFIETYAEKFHHSVSDQERQDLLERFLRRIRECRLPNRSKRRSEPRTVVRRENSFPILRGKRNTKHWVENSKNGELS